MASAFITRRVTAAGVRHVVRYRLGGRAYPIQHAGSFPTKREADQRRAIVAGELAASRDPALLLAAMRTPPAPVKVVLLAELGERYLRSRIDLDAKTERAHRSALERIKTWAGDRDPRGLTLADCRELVGQLVAGDKDNGVAPLKPSSVRKYFNVLKLVLDFGGVEPNPARDGRVKLPSVREQEPNPQTGKQFISILDNLPDKWVLPFVTREQTGTYIAEVLSVAWGDVDVAERTFRLRFANVKAGIRARARTVHVPLWLMDAIEETCPLEDRTADRRVFQGLTADGARKALDSACQFAGIPHFTPKNLRERRASIWHHDGLPAKVLAERLGHSKASMSLDIYTHTVDPGEVPLSLLRSRVER